MKSFKPYLAVAAVLLLLVVGVGGALAEQGQKAPLNPEFENFMVDYLQGRYTGMTPEGFPLGYMPPPVDLQALNPEPLKAAIEPLGLPTKFDWRTTPGYSAVTPVKNQASCGSCWAFGNMGAIESNYKKNTAGHPNLDLSEDNMIDIRDAAANKYCHWPWLWTRCGGGNTWLATSYLTGLIKKSATLQFQKGALLESSDTYHSTAGYANPCCTANRPLPTRRINGTRWVASDTTSMKNAVYTKGPIVTAYYAQSPGGSHWYSSNTIYHYPGYTGGTNHEVLIIGWDDTIAWPGGGGTGAWIIKNSWGSFNSMGGFFYLTYGSAKVGSDGMYYTSTRAYNAKEQLYMEDLPGWIYNWGWGTTTGYGLTVFAPVNAGEKLTHVEFYNPFANKTHTIKVWRTVTSTTTSATVASQLGTAVNVVCQEPGYYTVALPSAISTYTLTKAHKYAVEIKFAATTGYNYPLPIAGPSTGVVGAFAGQGNATGYGRGGATGAFARLTDSDGTYAPNIRARTLRP